MTLYLALHGDPEATCIVGAFETFDEAEEAAVEAAKSTRFEDEISGRIYYSSWWASVAELELGKTYEPYPGWTSTIVWREKDELDD